MIRDLESEAYGSHVRKSSNDRVRDDEWTPMRLLRKAACDDLSGITKENKRLVECKCMHNVCMHVRAQKASEERTENPKNFTYFAGGEVIQCSIP